MMKWLALTPLAIVAFASGASAQVGGSYQDTCDNIRQRGPYLSAECQTVDGDTRRSSIDVRGCTGGVANRNGRLTCGRRAYRGYDDGGDYGSRGSRYGYSDGYSSYRRDGYAPDDNY